MRNCALVFIMILCDIMFHRTHEYHLQGRRIHDYDCDYDNEWIEKLVFSYTREKFNTRVLRHIYIVRPDHLEPKSLRWKENCHLNIFSIIQFVMITTRYFKQKEHPFRANHILGSISLTYY